MYNYNGFYGLALPEDANMSINYWTRSLYQRLTALIKIKNLPQASAAQYGWDRDALMYGLLFMGYQTIFESRTYGVVPQPGHITGIGLQFQPTGAVVNTPYFQFLEPLRIGVNCELLKLTPDYSGVMDIVTKYAAELKETDTSIKAASRHSRLAFALLASDDRTAKTLKAIRERVINGEDAIIDDTLVRKSKADPIAPPWFEFDRDLKSNYILGDLLEARRNTLIDFYREIGVRMLDDKKERMITGEVAAGNAETFIRSEVWAETLKTSVEKINKMFGLDLQIEINKPDILGSDSGREGAENVY